MHFGQQILRNEFETATLWNFMCNNMLPLKNDVANAEVMK